MDLPQLHIVALPHTQTTREHASCAYTQKVYRGVQMFSSLGYKVFHYGAEGSRVDPRAEHVQIISAREQEMICPRREETGCYKIEWNPTELYWALTNAMAAREINQRARKGDLVLVIGGSCNEPLAKQLRAEVLVVEWGIGYEGVFAPYRVYESYWHMARVWQKVYGDKDFDGRFYEVCIPNSFDPDDYQFRAEPEDYCLYLGRVIKRKGVGIAVEATRRAGVRLLIAGTGVRGAVKGRVIGEDGEVYEGDHISYAGYANIEQRSQLMGGARALLAPTLYQEPYGGTAVECQFCGCPAITTDWAAFVETVRHGQTGYRCRTLEQFVWAIQNVGKLPRQAVRDQATARYSMHRVKYMYHEFFQMLGDLWKSGWSELRPGREELDWLCY